MMRCPAAASGSRWTKVGYPSRYSGLGEAGEQADGSQGSRASRNADSDRCGNPRFGLRGEREFCAGMDVADRRSG